MYGKSDAKLVKTTSTKLPDREHYCTKPLGNPANWLALSISHDVGRASVDNAFFTRKYHSELRQRKHLYATIQIKLQTVLNRSFDQGAK